MVETDELTIATAYDKLLATNNKIELLERLRQINSEPLKAAKLKEILTSGGRTNNDQLFYKILGEDKNSIELRELYQKKASYEAYILAEINRMSLSAPTIAIVFLKDIQKFSWKEIAKKLYDYYSERKIRNFYYEYKEKLKLTNKIYGK